MNMNIASNLQRATKSKKAYCRRNGAARLFVRNFRLSNGELLAVEMKAKSLNIPLAVFIRSAVVSVSETDIGKLIELKDQRCEILKEIFSMIQDVAIALNYAELMPKLWGNTDIKFIRRKISEAVSALSDKGGNKSCQY